MDGTRRSITVRATSADGSTADTVFTVAICDVDEYNVTPPLYTTTATADALPNNSAPGTSVGITAFSTDNDSTTNAVSYSLFDSDGGRFADRKRTGVKTSDTMSSYGVFGLNSRRIKVRARSADGSTDETVLTVAIG